MISSYVNLLDERIKILQNCLVTTSISGLKHTYQLSLTISSPAVAVTDSCFVLICISLLHQLVRCSIVVTHQKATVTWCEKALQNDIRRQSTAVKVRDYVGGSFSFARPHDQETTGFGDENGRRLRYTIRAQFFLTDPLTN